MIMFSLKKKGLKCKYSFWFHCLSTWMFTFCVCFYQTITERIGFKTGFKSSVDLFNCLPFSPLVSRKKTDNSIDAIVIIIDLSSSLSLFFLQKSTVNLISARLHFLMDTMHLYFVGCRPAVSAITPLVPIFLISNIICY